MIIEFIYGLENDTMNDLTEMQDFDQDDLLGCTKDELVDYIGFLRRDIDDLEEDNSEYFEAISSFVSLVKKKGLVVED
jgi:hypothetical protein